MATTSTAPARTNQRQEAVRLGLEEVTGSVSMTSTSPEPPGGLA
ncbi:MAG: hypothetical protein ACRYG2_34015 [Janthinobacterium lividum]